MSNDALILDLSANLAPVRRRRATREAVLLLALGAAELAMLLGLGLMRPDRGRILVNGTFAELKQLHPPAKVEYIEKQPTLEDIFLQVIGDDDRPPTTGTIVIVAFDILKSSM